MSEFDFPEKIRVFNGVGPNGLRVDVLVDYLCSRMGSLVVEIYGDFILQWVRGLSESEKSVCLSDAAKAFAAARVLDPFRESNGKATRQAVAYERKMLERTPPRPVGLLYDGFLLQAIYGRLLSAVNGLLETPTFVFTNQLFGTREEESGRYHVRVIILGHPCLISTTGLVEGPAKPREYYVKKSLGIDPLRIKEEFRDRFIDHNDPRVTEVMKGYLMQAVFYYVTGEPFCDDPMCRLFNAHWQEEVLLAQLGEGKEFCEYHSRALEGIRGSRTTFEEVELQ